MSPQFNVLFSFSIYTLRILPLIMLLRSLNSASLALSLLSSSFTTEAFPSLEPRQVPANATGVNTIKSPTGVTIRYKEPGKEGICETTPGVGSYAGYVDLAPDSHTFFWFFEARHNPETAPLTLWLNGGPGSDSLIGLFQGACNSSIEYQCAKNCRIGSL